MIHEKWTDLVSSLASSLFPLPGYLNHEGIVTFCLRKRSKLLDFIGRMKIDREEKSAERARQFMRDGDDKFQSQFFKESLMLYTKSILYAPNDSPDLSLAYVRRSLVLLHLGSPEGAITDIGMALHSGFSKQETLKNVIQLLQNEENYKAVTILYEVLKELNVLLKEHYKENAPEIYCKSRRYGTKWNLPVLKNFENPDFPSSSNCLQVLYSNEKGRYVVAKCDISAGDVLFVEKAFAFTVINSYCTGCGSEINTPIPCLGCVDINFCSLNCRDDVWKSFHKFECGFINLISETGIGYLALRIILRAASNLEILKEIIQKFISKKELKQSQKNSPVTFSNNTYENVYYLQTHINRMYIEDLLQYSLTATLLALYLVHHTNYAEPTEENIKLLGQILLHHITQLVCNANSLSHLKEADRRNIPVEGYEKVKFGGGIYPSISMMNHSCEANTTSCGHDDVLIVRARKDIKKGEEVFNCYGVESRQMERSKRREMLKAAYFINCRCSSCSLKYDPYDVLNSLKCEKCRGPVVSYSEGEKALNNDFICLNCDSHQCLQEEQWRRLREIHRLIEDGKSKLENGVDVEGALRAFVKSWTLGRAVLYNLHVNLYHSAYLIAHCLYLLNDLKPCISFLKCAVLCAEGRYGRLDIIHGYLAKKLLQCILIYCRAVVKGGSPVDFSEFDSMRELVFHYQDIVENVMNLNYGDDHPEVSEIREIKKEFQELMPTTWVNQ